MPPLEIAGRDRDAEYFGAGLTEAVSIAQVSKVTHLDVVSRTPQMQCKATGVSALEIGRCPA